MISSFMVYAMMKIVGMGNQVFLMVFGEMKIM